MFRANFLETVPGDLNGGSPAIIPGHFANDVERHRIPLTVRPFHAQCCRSAVRTRKPGAEKNAGSTEIERFPISFSDRRPVDDYREPKIEDDRKSLTQATLVRHDSCVAKVSILCHVCWTSVASPEKPLPIYYGDPMNNAKSTNSGRGDRVTNFSASKTRSPGSVQLLQSQNVLL